MTGRSRVLFAFLAMLVMPGLATASTVTLTDYNVGNSNFFGNPAEGGGPFLAATTDSGLSPADFITFVVGFNDVFDYGLTYDFTLSDNATSGGTNSDPLSDATKWLYYAVASGGYSSIYTAATGLGLSNDVGTNFQYAFWYLEEERTASEIGGTLSPGYGLAMYALANQNWHVLAAAGNRVYAMNTEGEGGHHQDLLAYDFGTGVEEAAVPEPATLLLFGTGLVVMARQFRKKKKSHAVNS